MLKHCTLCISKCMGEGDVKFMQIDKPTDQASKTNNNKTCSKCKGVSLHLYTRLLGSNRAVATKNVNYGSIYHPDNRPAPRALLNTLKTKVPVIGSHYRCLTCCNVDLLPVADMYVQSFNAKTPVDALQKRIIKKVTQIKKRVMPLLEQHTVAQFNKALKANFFVRQNEAESVSIHNLAAFQVHETIIKPLGVTLGVIPKDEPV